MVEYRYVLTRGPLDAEPRIVELEADLARLEVDIPLTARAFAPTATPTRATVTAGSPSTDAARRFENRLLGRVRVKPTADDSYEISQADLKGALENGVQLLAEAWPKVWPSGSFRGGLGLDVQSPIADGTLVLRGSRVRTSRSGGAFRSAT